MNEVLAKNRFSVQRHEKSGDIKQNINILDFILEEFWVTSF